MASALTWPIDDAAVSKFVGPPLEVVSVDSYRWVVIVGGILAFSMAWGIGANDIANAFATSVGSGALTLRWACIIGAVMEFSGAILLGSHVTDTVRSKIIDGDSFDPVKGGSANGPELLMTAFMCALLSATIWLVVATYLELPVSTTHSIIGSLVGTGMVYRGPDSVNWISEGSGLNKMNGVVGIVLSWIISPLLSGVFAVSLFIIVRTLVLRAKNPVRNCYVFLPFFYAFTVAIACFFIIYKGSPRLGLDKKLNAAQCVGIALGTGAVVGVLSYLLLIPLAKKWIARWEAEELEKSKNPEAALEAAYKCAKVDTALAKVGVNVRLKDELDDDVIQLHDNVEKFDPKTEKLFTWLQVFTSSFDSFAHGANDVANAIGPFASIYQLWKGAGVISAVKTGEFARDLTLKGGLRDGEKVEAGDALPDGSAFCGNVDGVEYFKCKLNFPSTTLLAGGAKSAEFELYNAVGVAQGITKCNTECGPGNSAKYTSSKKSVELWILALGGAGIVAGLSMWGYRIIAAIGQKLTKLTPSRGFCIELGSAICVIFASRVGLPVSTTHCQVGATMGVGLAEFKANTVNWKQFFFIFVGWVFTLIFTGLLAAGMFALLVHAPTAYNNEKDLNICPGDRLFTYDEQLKQFRGIACSGRV